MYLTTLGLFASLVGSFWAYAYTRLARTIRRYLEFREGKRVEEKVGLLGGKLTTGAAKRHRSTGSGAQRILCPLPARRR